MQTIDLQPFEIYILLNCGKGIYSRTKITQLGRVRREGMKSARNAIATLIDKKLIAEHELPRLGARKTPVFYEITDKGKSWINRYNKILADIEGA